MKLFLNGLICASLLVFAIGCGSEKKGGGGGGTPAPVQPSLVNSGLSANSQQVLTNVTNWYNGATEGYAPASIVKVVKTEYTMNTAPNCTQKKFLGIPFNYCTYSGSSQQTNQTVTPNVYIASTQGQAINAKGNAELNAIFSGGAGTLMDAQESGNIAYLQFLRGDGVVVTYQIDRSVHSAANPVLKREENQSQRKDIVTTLQI